jgi:transposase
VVSFVDKQIQRGDELTAEQIGSALKKQLGVVLHTRTIEKLVKEIRSKKNS